MQRVLNKSHSETREYFLNFAQNLTFHGNTRKCTLATGDEFKIKVETDLPSLIFRTTRRRDPIRNPVEDLELLIPWNPPSIAIFTNSPNNLFLFSFSYPCLILSRCKLRFAPDLNRKKNHPIDRPVEVSPVITRSLKETILLRVSYKKITRWISGVLMCGVKLPWKRLRCLCLRAAWLKVVSLER